MFARPTLKESPLASLLGRSRIKCSTTATSAFSFNASRRPHEVARDLAVGSVLLVTAQWIDTEQSLSAVGVLAPYPPLHFDTRTGSRLRQLKIEDMPLRSPSADARNRICRISRSAVVQRGEELRPEWRPTGVFRPTETDTPC